MSFDSIFFHLANEIADFLKAILKFLRMTGIDILSKDNVFLRW
ncbi:hypothetical protein LEP1GSC040_0772 [Leptospira santarosai str. 2000030832]|nr:hypothetical protein LEP1GSC040_0772 [Leptospira santarosai str. 2000030832]